MAAAADDPIVGVWNLNLAKSRYRPGPTPQRQTMKFEPAGLNSRAIEQIANHMLQPFDLTPDAVADGRWVG